MRTGAAFNIVQCSFDGDFSTIRNRVNRFVGSGLGPNRPLDLLVDDVVRGFFGIAQFFRRRRFAYEGDNKFSYGL